MGTYPGHYGIIYTRTNCSSKITGKQDCVSCEEFESKLQSQQREIESLQKQLNYWQNTTIDILEKYPIDGKEMFPQGTN